MTAPDPRIQNQLRHDVDGVYELLAATQKKVGVIAMTQHRHGNRLEEIQQSLDLQSGRLERLDDTQQQVQARLGGVEDRLGGVEDRLGGLEETQQQIQDRLGRLEGTQQQILDLLRGRPDRSPA